MVIERPEGGKFKIRRVLVDEKSPEKWDLAVLRGPVHPAGYKSSSEEYITCDYLSLKFPTPREREDFDDILRTYMGLYRKAAAESEQLEREAIQDANRPRKKYSNNPYAGSGSVVNPRSGSVANPRSGSVNTGGSSTSRAPRLPSMYFSSINLN